MVRQMQEIKSHNNLSENLKVRKYDHDRKHQERKLWNEMKECGITLSEASKLDRSYIREKSSGIRDKLPKNIQNKFVILQHAMEQI